MADKGICWSSNQHVQQHNSYLEELNGFLEKCVVGSFNGYLKVKPMLAEIWNWSVSTRENAFEVNMHEMGGCLFLFEFQINIWRNTSCRGIDGGSRWRFIWNGGYRLPAAGCCLFSQQNTDIESYGSPIPSLDGKKLQSQRQSLWRMGGNRWGDVTKKRSKMGENKETKEMEE